METFSIKKFTLIILEFYDAFTEPMALEDLEFMQSRSRFVACCWPPAYICTHTHACTHIHTYFIKITKIVKVLYHRILAVYDM